MLALLAVVLLFAVPNDSSSLLSKQVQDDADKLINYAIDNPATKTFVFDRVAYLVDTFGPRFSGMLHKRSR